jgi:flagellar hook-basal body complex protein FliE
MVTPIIAAKAYAATQQVGGADMAGAGGVGGIGGGPDFGQMVNSAIHDAISSSRAAESQMTAQVQGKASLVDVVTAISSAETSLQTVIAVRDQMIAAYQQVMNMSI